VFTRSQAPAWERNFVGKLLLSKRLKLMRTRYRITENNYPYFITSTTLAWILVFTRKPYIEVLINALNFCRRSKGVKIFAYVVMDNHIHLVVASERLSEIIKEFKSYTAREIVRLARQDKKSWLLSQLQFHKPDHKTDSRHQVWQEGFHPQQIFSEEVLHQKVDYLHHNPVRAGLVARAEDWFYSSARSYAGLPGALEIDKLEI
jgi:putative transposase